MMDTKMDSVKSLFFPQEEDNNITTCNNTDITETTVETELLHRDFLKSRKAIRSVISSAKLALENLNEVIKSTDSPRAFEVANQLLNTISTVSKDLLDVHEKYQKLKIKPTTPLNQKNIQNNVTVFNGTTKELLEIIQQQGKIHENI